MRRPRIYVLALMVASVSSMAIGSVYRCESGGKVIYSDKPCDDAGKSAAVSVVPSASDNSVTPALEPYQLQREAGMGRVVVGQSADQVRQAWGDPKSINIDTNAQGRSDRWVYDRDGLDAYVYLQNGRVTAVSTHSSSAAAPAPTAVVVPPTQDELDTRERADKAAERKFVRPMWSRGRVLDAIGPPERNINNGGQWIYLPTTKDPQTVTTVTFDGDNVFDVKRDVVNR